MRHILEDFHGFPRSWSHLWHRFAVAVDGPGAARASLRAPGSGTGTGRSAGVQRQPVGIGLRQDAPPRMGPGRQFEGEVPPRQIPGGTVDPARGPESTCHFPMIPGSAPC